MKKVPVGFMAFVLVAACILGPASAMPALACGMGAGCCESACNCGMQNQAVPMPLAMAPAVSAASFDPSLMAQTAQSASLTPAADPTAPPTAPSPPAERSDHEKLYDSQSNYRL